MASSASIRKMKKSMESVLLDEQVQILRKQNDMANASILKSLGTTGKKSEKGKSKLKDEDENDLDNEPQAEQISTDIVKENYTSLSLLTQKQNESLKSYSNTDIGKNKDVISTQNERFTNNLEFDKTMQDIEYLVGGIRKLHFLSDMALDVEKGTSKGETVQHKDEKNIVMKSSNGLNLNSMIHSNSQKNKGNTQKGRKSLKIITEGLFKKVEVLKTTQMEMDLFLARIEKYHEIDKKYAKKNSKFVVETPKQIEKKKKLKSLKDSENSAKVLERKKKTLESKAVQTATEIEKKQKTIVQRLKDRELQDKQDKIYDIKFKWFILMILGSRIHVIHKILYEAEQNRLERFFKNNCAKIIQRNWKRFNYLRRERLKLRAMAKIKKAVVRYLPTLRKNIKVRAAEVIKDFFRCMSETSRLLQVINNFKVNVVMCQRAAKNSLLVNKEQINYMKLRWINYEYIWWQKKTNEISAKSQQLLSKSTENIGNSESDLASSIKKKKRNDQKKGNEKSYKIPPHIRDPILYRVLKERKKEFSRNYWEFREKLQKWKKQNELFKIQLLKMSDGHATNPLGMDKTEINELNLTPAQLLSLDPCGLHVSPITGLPYVPSFKNLSETEFYDLIQEAFLINAKNSTKSQ